MKSIEEYVAQNPLADRQKHIDLNAPCMPSVLGKNYGGKKAGEYTAIQVGKSNAKEVLKGYLNLSGKTSLKIHTCHLCVNDSSAPNGFVCINPQHLYFGTASENVYDRPEDARKEFASKGGKKSGPKVGKKTIHNCTKTAIANGNHIAHKSVTCPHCGKSGQKIAMKRWHFDNCKQAVS